MWAGASIKVNDDPIHSKKEIQITGYTLRIIIILIDIFIFSVLYALFQFVSIFQSLGTFTAYANTFFFMSSMFFIVILMPFNLLIFLTKTTIIINNKTGELSIHKRYIFKRKAIRFNQKEGPRLQLCSLFFSSIFGHRLHILTKNRNEMISFIILFFEHEAKEVSRQLQIPLLQERINIFRYFFEGDQPLT